MQVRALRNLWLGALYESYSRSNRLWEVVSASAWLQFEPVPNFAEFVLFVVNLCLQTGQSYS